MPVRAAESVRRAEPADLSALLPLIEALARHHGDQPHLTAASLFRDLFTEPRWLHGFVAQTQGTIIGYASLLPLARLHLGQRGMDLHHLFVAEPARGGGVGTQLVQAAQTYAKGLGCSYLTVGTQSGNRAAQDFYQRRGFFASPPAPDRFAFDLSVWTPSNAR